jgi:hypothetical protein
LPRNIEAEVRQVIAVAFDEAITPRTSFGLAHTRGFESARRVDLHIRASVDHGGEQVIEIVGGPTFVRDADGRCDRISTLR